MQKPQGYCECDQQDWNTWLKHLVNGGYEVELVDLALEDDFERPIEERIKSNSFLAVGISIFNTRLATKDGVHFCLPEIKEIVSHVRSLTSAPVILGGFGFSIQPKEILSYVDGDYGVSGCGVPAMLTLLIRIKEGKVERGCIFEEEPREYLNMFFKRDMVDVTKYRKGGFAACVSAKYGCIGKCMFCPCARNNLRLRPPYRVIAEIRNLVRQGFENISFTDDMTNVPVEYARSICKGITDLSDRLTWSGIIWPLPQYFPEDLAGSMKRAGMVAAYVNGHSGSDRMLKIYRSGFSTKDIEYTTRILEDKGIKATPCFVFGGPGECKETIDETFALIDKLQPDAAALFTKIWIVRPSELASIAEKKGIVSPTDDLLAPVHYPFPLRGYVLEEAERRENCRIVW